MIPIFQPVEYVGDEGVAIKKFLSFLVERGCDGAKFVWKVLALTIDVYSESYDAAQVFLTLT